MISHDLWQIKKKKKKKKQYCNKFNKDFKNGPHQKNKQINKGKARGPDDVTWGKSVETERNLVTKQWQRL